MLDVFAWVLYRLHINMRYHIGNTLRELIPFNNTDLINGNAIILRLFLPNLSRSLESKPILFLGS